MANHAQVLTGRKLDPKEVDRIIRRLNKEKLKGLFKIEYLRDRPNGYGKHEWYISYGEPKDFMTMVMWLDDEEQYGEDIKGEWVAFEHPKLISRQSVIEFRHGHSFQFMWWVEGVFRENLGKHYKASMMDDGVGEMPPPDPAKYATFETYVTNKGKVSLDELRTSNRWLFEREQLEAVPSELIEKLKLDVYNG